MMMIFGALKTLSLLHVRERAEGNVKTPRVRHTRKDEVMSRAKFGVTRSAVLFKRTAALLCTVIVLLFAQPWGHAQVPARPPLKLFKNYFLAGGDYAVGGIGLRGQGDSTTHLATGTIAMIGVPAGADISAAFLYWITLEPVDSIAMSDVGYFRGQEISGKLLNPAGVTVPGCWGSGGGGTTSNSTTARVYRADVLRHLPVSENPDTLGKVLVNDTDLTLNGKALHQVKLRDFGGGGTQAPSSGNQVTYVEGASLVVVYRVATAPLRAVVIYDGAVTADANFPVMDLTLKGFYQASATAAARMTHLVGNGDGFQEQLTVNGTPVPGTNPFGGASGAAWDNPTYSVSGLAITDSVSTKVEPVVSSVDCLEWGAVLSSMNVQDTDRDGIVDVVEDQIGGLTDPNGQPLPAFHDMGASSTVPDVFVEFGFFKTDGWGPSSPVGVHDHRPSANALAMTAKAFKRAGINAHFDVGDDDADIDHRYPAALDPLSSSCANLATWSLGCAIVPNDQARGGEFITEAACGPVPGAPCQFPNDKGVVGWKSGYVYYQLAPVASNGAQLTFDEEQALEESCETGGACPLRRRLDANRMDFVHYSLWAHALGLPKSPNQCVLPSVLDAVAGVCRDGVGNVVPDNPDYHVVTKSSGFGDKGGGDTLMSLHAFGFNYNGADIAQAGTLLHELAHNFDRSHGGEVLQRNCKSNYVSVLNYAFQVHGILMLDALGQPILDVDLSGQVLNPLNETGLTDSALTVVSGAGTVPMYPTRWYAPAATSFIHSGLQITPATKHCDGSPKLDNDPDMVRVDGTSATGAIDWLADGDTTDVTPFSQDINYNGGPNSLPSPDGVLTDGPFAGSNDWLYVTQHGLQQVGSRPNMGLSSLEMSSADLGRGDPGRGDPGRGDPGRGDPGRGDPGRGDPGRGDPGRGDPGRGDPGAPPGDLDINTATGHSQAPYLFRAAKELKTVRLTWSASFVRPEGVSVNFSTVYRVAGTTITPSNFADRKLIGTAIGTLATVVDAKPLSGKPVVYILIEDWSNLTRSGFVATSAFTYK
jgi:hypothetical protein